MPTGLGHFIQLVGQLGLSKSGIQEATKLSIKLSLVLKAERHRDTQIKVPESYSYLCNLIVVN